MRFQISEQGGLYNAEILLEGDNLGCFLLQSAAVAAPDFIREAGVVADIAGMVAQINDAIRKSYGQFELPPVELIRLQQQSFKSISWLYTI